MATSNSFDINSLYKKVFGITGVRFAIPDSNNVARQSGSNFDGGQLIYKGNLQPDYYDGIQTIPLPTANAYSILGTPIYEQITLTTPKIIKNGAVVSQPISYTLPGWPLFDITGQNTIEKTPMNGRKGTVKEFINEDDYSITIRGFLINDNSNEYPEQELQDFMKIITCKSALHITSQVFNILDIHNIAIEKWSLPEVEGYQNIQPFELECVSDEDAILNAKDIKKQQKIIPGL